MTWNYRIILHEDGHYALHEVYYDENGKPRGATENPITFAVDNDEGVDGIIGSLEMALRDARTKPILKKSDFD